MADPDLPASRRHVLETAREQVLPVLAAHGTVAWLGGAWAGCEDLGHAVQYAVGGRLDLPAGAPRPAADPLLAALTARGWSADHDRGRGSRRRGLRRGDLRLELVEYDGEDFVLIDLNGPCLGAERAILDALLAEPRTHLIQA